jgi:hypothetical protein
MIVATRSKIIATGPQSSSPDPRSLQLEAGGLIAMSRKRSIE